MTEAKFYLFDMDHTLIQADCDVTWKQFAVAHGLAPETALAEADRFFDDYNAGCLDLELFHEFQFREFAGNTVERMAELAEQHFKEFIADRIYPDAVKLIGELRSAGIPVGILTSTNSVIATPVARAFGIDLVLGTRLELRDGRYTGRISGIYGVGPGKVEIAAAELERRGLSFAELAYYGDSINDRYILDACGFPYTVNPSASLRALAEQAHWPILRWKRETAR